jgi:aldehyde:ferredoxin oxidoreductase
LPERLLGIPPHREGPLAGVKIHIDTLLRGYYGARDWNLETGWPSKAKLKSLGLLEIVDKAGLAVPNIKAQT